MNNQTKRVALVTGGARGIGAGVALRLAADGFAVAVVDLSADACQDVVSKIDKAGGTAIAVSADVSDEQSVAVAVDRVAETLGPPLAVVNNAGVTRDNLLFKMTVEEWDSVLNVHLRGSFLVSRAAQKFMTDAGWGRIVNVSSTSALGNRGQANYSAAKAGIQGFTKTLAIELGRFGVTVNAVAPGFIETDMTIATAARLGISFDELKAAMVKDIPVQRSGVPADVASAVSFFLREDASFISGQVLYVAGGPKG
jgi:3-oxoacyl-[acyl-carrier protein] reductase